MRKFYSLFAAFLISLAGFNSANARNVTPDVANFTFTIDAPNNNVYFTNTSSIGSEPGPRHAFWNFGDAVTQMTGPLDNTQHHYQVAGTYNVCLRIYRYRPNIGDSVLTAYICKTFIIQTVCNADFITLNVAANPLLKYFVAQPAHNQNKKPLQICWQFGDGRDTCINYTTAYTGAYGVSHTYANGGNYNVCVNIHYDGGCVAYKCHPVLVSNPDSCAADFERIASAGTNPLLAYFKALPQHNNNRKPSKVCWTFGEGGRGDTCVNYTESFTGLYAISHTYLHPGQYQVCVQITYFGGCIASKCKPIQMGVPDSCGADFERLATPNSNPLLAYYKALPQHNNNRKPSRVCWNFGEGGRGDTCINYTESFTGQYVISHTYLHPGAYQVCVHITYYGGCEATKCKPIQIGVPDSCGADFERISPQPTSLSVYLKALPQHNNNRKPSQVCWQFGDGRDTCINYPENFTGLYVVSHLYPHLGQYQVCVHITYYGGCEATRCKPIQVGSVPDTCGADFERIASAGTNPLLAYYKALPQHNNNRKPSKVCWTFGEGGRGDTCINYSETYTGLYVISHTYLHPGAYQVCVQITYYGGCIADKCKPIQIGPPDSCGADFERIQSTNTNPLLAYYKALPQHNNNRKPSIVCWEFGDGQTSCINYTETYTGQYVTSHTYLHPGVYQVCVHITYYGGCEATRCKPIQISVPDSCGADFERIPNTGTNPLLSYYRALPQHNNNRKPSRICWTFGEGGRGDTCINYTETYTGQYVISHEYLHPGLYQVCVHITYYGGCQADKCKPIQIGAPDSCGADFERISPVPTSLSVYLKALPQHNNNRKPSQVCWQFGDGRDTCINYPENFTGLYVVSHLYPHPGQYQVCVHITYYGGCSATRCKPIQVAGIPDTCGADFERITSSGTNPLLAYYRALLQHNNNRKPSQICWHFGDGRDTCINYLETYTGQYVVSHQYAQPGQYQVCVQITYYGGCVATKCKIVPITGNQPILVLSPNPVINILHVDFFSTHTEQVNIKIFNSTGNPVRTYTQNVTIGLNSWTHDLSNLMQGVFSYTVQSPTQLASAAFIKL